MKRLQELCKEFGVSLALFSVSIDARMTAIPVSAAIRIWLVGAALLALGGVVPAAAGESRGYVVNVFDASSANSSLEIDCPNGIRDSGANVTRILQASGMTASEINKTVIGELAGHDVSFPALRTRGRIDGKPANPYFNPTSVSDPNVTTVDGKYAVGFNLDGNEATGGFIDPETGEKGVDNQLFRVSGCNPFLAIRRKMPAWLIEVSGIENVRNSLDVEVRVSNAIGSTLADESVPRDMTFQEDANLTTKTTVHAVIKNGVLTTDVMPTLNLNGDRMGLPEMRWTKARLRLKFEVDGSVTGVIGGYHKWAPLYTSLIEFAPIVETYGVDDVPGIYFALRKFADADPDPQLGLNTSISTAFTFKAVPAFIHRASPTNGAQGVPVQSRATNSGSAYDGVPANPPGITIKVIHIGTAEPGRPQPRDRTVFADQKGLTLYTADQDPKGQSRCFGECSRIWLPVTASRGSKPAEYWSIIDRGDGSRQWAFRGKAVYTYAPETVPQRRCLMYSECAEAWVIAESDRTFSQPRANKEPRSAATQQRRDDTPVEPGFVLVDEGKGQDVDGHHVLEILPAQWIALPSGVLIQEVRTAPGYVLTDGHGLPLYGYEDLGRAKNGPEFGRDWTPFPAPEASLPVGDFTILTRNDGLRQWAYRGKSLYRFGGDVEHGDSNGKHVDPHFRLAYIVHYFMPEGVIIQNDRTYGGLLALNDGVPLYAREITPKLLTNSPRGDLGQLEIGEYIGVSGCDSECEQSWKPLIAPNNASPNGYWTLYARPDGRKQWAYYGYALYSPVTTAATANLYDGWTGNFEALPNGEVRDRWPMHWRLSPP